VGALGALNKFALQPKKPAMCNNKTTYQQDPDPRDHSVSDHTPNLAAPSAGVPPQPDSKVPSDVSLVVKPIFGALDASSSVCEKASRVLQILGESRGAVLNRAERRHFLPKILDIFRTSNHPKAKPRRARAPLPLIQELIDSGDWVLFNSYSEDGAVITILKSASGHGEGCIVSRISTKPPDKRGEVLITQFGDVYRAALDPKAPIGIGWLMFAYDCSARVPFQHRVDYRALFQLIEEHGVRIVLWKDVSRLARNELAFHLLMDRFSRMGVLLFVDEVGGLVNPDDDATKQMLLAILAKVSEIQGRKIATSSKNATWARRMFLGLGYYGPPAVGLRRAVHEFVEVDPATFPACRFVALAMFTLYYSSTPEIAFARISELFIEELGVRCGPSRVGRIITAFPSPRDAKVVVRLLAEAGINWSESAVRDIAVRTVYSDGIWSVTIDGDLKMEMEPVKGLVNPIPMHVIQANTAALETNSSRRTSREICESTIHDRTFCGYCGARLEVGLDRDGAWQLRHKKAGSCCLNRFVADGVSVEEILNEILIALETNPEVRQLCFELMASERDEAVTQAYVLNRRASVEVDLARAGLKLSEAESELQARLQVAASRGVVIDEQFESNLRQEIGIDGLLRDIARLYADKSRLDSQADSGSQIPIVRTFRDDPEAASVLCDVLSKPLGDLTSEERVLRYFIVRRCVSGIVLAPVGDPRSGITDVIVLGSLGPLGERLEGPIRPSHLTTDLGVRGPLRPVSECIDSETRRSAAAKWKGDELEGIKELIRAYGAVPEVAVNGVPDWMWAGTIPAGHRAIRWANAVSGWQFQGHGDVEVPTFDTDANLADKSVEQRRTEYAPLSDKWCSDRHEQVKLF
jgi:hypothetical protein